jgi:hypothetical protein
MPVRALEAGSPRAPFGRKNTTRISTTEGEEPPVGEALEDLGPGGEGSAESANLLAVLVRQNSSRAFWKPASPSTSAVSFATVACNAGVSPARAISSTSAWARSAHARALAV